MQFRSKEKTQIHSDECQINYTIKIRHKELLTAIRITEKLLGEENTKMGKHRKVLGEKR